MSTISEKADLRPSHLADFLKAARPRHKGNHYITDLKCTGLSLRLKGEKVSFFLRYKGINKTLGWAHAGEGWYIPSIKAGRELADKVKRQIDFGGEPFAEEFLRQHHHATENNLDLSHDDIVREMRPKVGTWTLQQCIEKAIEDRTADTATKPWRETTVSTLKSTFAKPEFADLLDMPAVNLKRSDIERIRDTMLKKHASPAPAGKAVSNVSTVLSHCQSVHGGQSGLDRIEPWWRLLTVGRTVKPRTRNPGLEGLAKTLILADIYTEKRLPGRMQAKHDHKYGIRDGVAAAFHWVCLTAQRQGAALAIQKTDYIPDPENEGWYLAAWGEGIMKAGVAHVLPIPPRLVDHMAQKLQQVKRDESRWLLPSERGQEDIHIHRSSTLAVIQRLGARDTLTKKRETAVDLLAVNGIKWWTPHDLRRTITKVLDDAGIPGGASAILAHEIKQTDKLDGGNEDWQEQRVARITRLAYGGAQHIHLKRKAMMIWADTVLDEYDRIKSEWHHTATHQRQASV
ncbi:hypothetical protein [Agrobacterium pusense]|uniref:hypothetical protein n=1 Tax=Agrobacterium pusense TaxID=648995 RepID=UPI000513A8F3|nr:hypothetical protein [Agrobacterium pusense]ANV24599.1 hypothetical protein BA939_12025 [Rhizobium sp. S41]KGE82912.1 hypothetical protein LW14_10510 [Rhizobium sp. H41]QWW74284.1 hypothetical protein KP800_01900 [Agrobacterium pusense]